jgi:hypothetical protein
MPDFPNRPLTIQELHAGEDFLWVNKPLPGLSTELRVLFFAAHEIATFLELTFMGPKDALAVAPDTIQVLRECMDCLTAVQHLSPCSVVTVILKMNRSIGGHDDGLAWGIKK